MSIADLSTRLSPEYQKLANGQREMIVALYREDHNRKQQSQGKLCLCGICQLAEQLGVLPEPGDTENAFGKPLDDVFRMLDAADKNPRT